MRGLYIKWNGPVSPWTLSYNNKTLNCGENGFVHEYIDLNEDVTSCTINIPKKISISDIMAYSYGKLPDDVQVWNKPFDNADILALAAHADDEILFLGGVLATYGGGQGLSVQVAYMCDFWNKEPVREHEKIDGLWKIGLRNYPVCGGFADIKSLSLSRAKEIYSYDEVIAFVTEQIRRFKPLICVTHDLNGEYGHGAHMILSHALCDSVENSADASFCPDSADLYGTHDVKKTYLHLYEDNRIKLDLHTPFSSLNGRTALEAASDAYLKHVSQQVWDFVVSDTYEHSCAEFGLYRTTVGNDTGNDMLEHITTYEEEARIKALEALKAEASSIAEAEKAEALKNSTTEAPSDKKTSDSSNTAIIIAAAILTALLLTICILNYIRVRNRRLKNRYRRKNNNRR